MHDILLKAENISCERDDRLLFSELSFELNAGEVLQLEGPNGSGKTTLLRILSGLFNSYEGKIKWRGEDIHQCLPEYHRNLLFLGHKSAITKALSPIENLRFLVNLHQQISDSELLEALSEVGLAGYEYVSCNNLSAGQQRRVSLARLALSKAKLWLLDEAFTAIDQSGVAQFEILLAQKAKSGVSIVLTTHHQLAMHDVRKLSLGEVSHA